MLAIDNEGGIYVSGLNVDGQIGLGSKKNFHCELEIKKIDHLRNIVGASFGFWHTGVINKEGELYMTGGNQHGALGLGNTSNSLEFEKVNISNIVMIDCGAFHTIVINSEGNIFGAGSNSSGQLGLPKRIINDYEFTESEWNEENYEWMQRSQPDNNHLLFQHIEVNEVICSVSCGHSHTFIINTKGDIFSTGYNSHGELGLGDKTNRYKFENVSDLHNIASISCGKCFTLALNKYAGMNNEGQLGLGDTIERLFFEKVSLKNVISINCGLEHSVAITKDEEIYVSGYNFLPVDSNEPNNFFLLTLK